MKNTLLMLSVVLILTGCGGKSNNPAPGGSSGTTTTTTTPPAPVKAVLTFPDQNAVCTSGKIISDTTSSITFTWNPSDNTDSYDLGLKNLLTGTTTTQNTAATQLILTLMRNTPYSWYIVSKSTKSSSTAQSDTWKFYNAGKGTVTYAPFPAELTSPTFGQSITTTTGTVNLTWKGTSVTVGTITGYDVYFGSTKTPALLKAGVTDSFLNGVAVVSKTTYYWKVVTKDVLGNTSDSGIYQFNVN